MKEYTASGIISQIETCVEKNAVRVISFDIFDTLLFRLVEKPIDIFRIVGDHAVKQGILPAYITGEDYRNIRIKAEKRARELQKAKDGCTEITYHQIFEAMPAVITENERLEALEYAIESDACYINPVLGKVLDTLRAKGYQIVGISDMYFSEKEIWGLLQKGGYQGDAFPIYVSSEWRETKNSGKLFHLVAEQLGVPLSQMFHIGDNYSSDYLMAKKQGMHALHYCLFDSDLYRGLFYEKMIYENNLPTLYTMRRYLPGLSERADHLWYQSGIQIYGPLLASFAEWVVDAAEKEQIRQIFPLMREGMILTGLLSREVEKRGLDIRIEPVYISRKAILIPSMTEVTVEKLEGIFNASQITVERVLAMFGLKSYAQEYRDIYGPEEGKSYFSLADEFYEFMQREDVRAQFEQYRKQKADSAYGYFEQMGMTERFITVDIGFHGTIQTGLEVILKEKGVHNPNIHLLAFSIKSTLDNVFQGADIRGYVGSFGENDELNTFATWHHRLLEQALMCDVGSTQDYRYQDGAFKPVLGDSSIVSAEQKKNVADMQQGIRDFQQEYLRIRDLKAGGIVWQRPNPAETAKVYMRIVRVPSLKEAGTYGRIVHDENYGVDTGYTLCEKEKIDYIKQHGFSEFAQTYDITEELWLEGLRTCSESGYEFQRLKQYAGSNLAKSMAELAQEIGSYIGEKKEQVVIVGAGEAGQTLCEFLRLLGIEVEGFIDNNQKLQGEIICEHPVQAMTHPYQSTVYALGTLAFADRLMGQALHTLKTGSVVMAYRDGAVKRAHVK